MTAVALTAAGLAGQSATYSNLEPTAVHPVRVSADGLRLYALNPNDDRLSVFDLRDPAAPRLLREIRVGLRPVSVTERSANELWVCNQLSDSVARSYARWPRFAALTRPGSGARPMQNPRVDAFVSRAKKWQGEIQKLRSILLDCGLEECLKWGKPCFMFEGNNLAIIQPFKKFCSLMFFKGALLEDRHGLLRSQGENTQSALRLEFTCEAEVNKTVVKSYVKQAIAAEKARLKVDFKAKHELKLPEELTQILQKDRKLAKAFDALTPGRQRGYVLHFTSAKQSQTRTARIEKCIPKILAGKGMNDR